MEHGIPEVHCGEPASPSLVCLTRRDHRLGWLSDRWDNAICSAGTNGLRGPLAPVSYRTRSARPPRPRRLRIFYGLDWVATGAAGLQRLAADTFGAMNVGIMFGWIAASHQFRGSDGRLRRRLLPYLLVDYSGDFHGAGLVCLIAAASCSVSVRLRAAATRVVEAAGAEQRAGRSLALAAAVFAALASPRRTCTRPHRRSRSADLCAGVPRPPTPGVSLGSWWRHRHGDPPHVQRAQCNDRAGIRVVAPSGRRVERGPARASGRSVSVDVDAASRGPTCEAGVSCPGTPSPSGAVHLHCGPATATVAAFPDAGARPRAPDSCSRRRRALHFLGYAFGFGSLAFRWLVLRPLAVRASPRSIARLWRLPRFGASGTRAREPLIVARPRCAWASRAMPTCWRMYWRRGWGW